MIIATKDKPTTAFLVASRDMKIGDIHPYLVGPDGNVVARPEQLPVQKTNDLERVFFVLIPPSFLTEVGNYCLYAPISSMLGSFFEETITVQ